jgi:hypothetical protein
VEHTEAWLRLSAPRHLFFRFTADGWVKDMTMEETSDGTFCGQLLYPGGPDSLVASVRNDGPRRWQFDVSGKSARGHERWALTIHAATTYDLPCPNPACDRGLIGDDVCPVCRGSGEAEPAPEQEPSPWPHREPISAWLRPAWSWLRRGPKT